MFPLSSSRLRRFTYDTRRIFRRKRLVLAVQKILSAAIVDSEMRVRRAACEGKKGEGGKRRKQGQADRTRRRPVSLEKRDTALDASMGPIEPADPSIYKYRTGREARRPSETGRGILDWTRQIGSDWLRLAHVGLMPCRPHDCHAAARIVLISSHHHRTTTND
jgi:hypothetical protein